MNDDGPILGKLIESNERRRDAIHVALAPVTAAVRLSPGEHVGLSVDNGTDALTVAPCETNIGIVDPYLEEPVEAGERFWLCLYPNSVTSLRHIWSHPAFAIQLKERNQREHS